MNKFNKYFRIFFEGDEDAGGGGSRVADILPPVGQTTAQPVIDDEDAAGGGDDPEPVKPTPTNVTLDPAAFAEAIKAAGLGGSAPQAPVQPDRPPTPEEIAAYKKQLKYWEGSPEFFQKFNNMDTQADAFREFHEAFTTQIATMMQAYFGQQAGALQQQFSPALGFIQQHQEQQLQARFDAAYEQLSKPELQPMRDYAIQRLAASGKVYKTEPEMFKALAEEMSNVIRAVNPEFKLTAGSSPAKPNPNAIKPAAKRGASGGGDRSTDPAAGVPLAVRHLPPVRA